jgi:hypothetical protein
MILIRLRRFAFNRDLLYGSEVYDALVRSHKLSREDTPVCQ